MACPAAARTSPASWLSRLRAGELLVQNTPDAAWHHRLRYVGVGSSRSARSVTLTRVSGVIDRLRQSKVQQLEDGKPVARRGEHKTGARRRWLWRTKPPAVTRNRRLCGHGAVARSHSAGSARRAKSGKGPRQRWHRRQPWQLGICKLLSPQGLTEFESHPLRNH